MKNYKFLGSCPEYFAVALKDAYFEGVLDICEEIDISEEYINRVYQKYLELLLLDRIDYAGVVS